MNIEASDSEDIDAVDDDLSNNNTDEEIDNTPAVSESIDQLRSKGPKTSKDLEKFNKFYKRSLGTFCLLMVHSFCLVSITGGYHQYFHPNFAFATYPVILLGFCGFFIYKNSKMTKELDAK